MFDVIELPAEDYAAMERDEFKLFCRPTRYGDAPEWAHIMPMTGFPELSAGPWRVAGPADSVYVLDHLELFDSDKRSIRLLPFHRTLTGMRPGDKLYVTYLATIEFRP